MGMGVRERKEVRAPEFRLGHVAGWRGHVPERGLLVRREENGFFLAHAALEEAAGDPDGDVGEAVQSWVAHERSGSFTGGRYDHARRDEKKVVG